MFTIIYLIAVLSIALAVIGNNILIGMSLLIGATACMLIYTKIDYRWKNDRRFALSMLVLSSIIYVIYLVLTILSESFEVWFYQFIASIGTIAGVLIIYIARVHSLKVVGETLRNITRREEKANIITFKLNPNNPEVVGGGENSVRNVARKTAPEGSGEAPDETIADRPEEDDN